MSGKIPLTMPDATLSGSSKGSGRQLVCPLEKGHVDPAAIRSELDRILVSASFRNSKRYSAVLKYLVDRTLEGRSEELKERTIGIEVFERSPDYDTNADHAVRSSASEIRKRLAQYYQEAGDDSGIRIDLYPGSYVPSFQAQAANGKSLAHSQLLSQAQEQVNPIRRRMVLFAAFAAGAALTEGYSAIRSWRSTTVLDRFWRPVVAGNGAAVVCVGRHIPTPASGGSSSPSSGSEANAEIALNSYRGFRSSDLVTGGDAIAMAIVTGQLERRGKPFRIFIATSASFEDFQKHSVVLVGGQNNDWTVQMLKPLRFRLQGPGIPVIIDTASSPPGKSWTTELGSGSHQYLRDYGLIARYKSSQTGEMALILAGTHGHGTLAAAQFLSDESLLSQLAAQAPRGWETMNLEIVLATDIVDGVNGRPKIVATYFW